MITFLIGIAVLIIGGFFGGKLCDRIFLPTDAPTPAITKNDGVDFVPISKKRNCLIELLNIAGTGPILGPIQGVLFGPIAFITIPIGCIIAGAVHDYLSGMISVRNDGEQLPNLVRKYMGKYIGYIYLAFTAITLFLLAAVFVYTPGDIFVGSILHQDNSAANPVVFIVYGIIFLYYICATVLPIDKIIGKVYPIFGALLILSAVGILFGIFFKGYPLTELWQAPLFTGHPAGQQFLPVFFVTVACGICSGFHATQSTIISRTVTSEKDGRTVFHMMMILEGVIAMIWAAAAMGVYNLGLADASTTATDVVGIVAENIFGRVGSIVALVGIIILPITSGDTACRSLRIILADALLIDKTKKNKIMVLMIAIVVIVGGLLVFSKISPQGFNILWRYFGWANQTLATFTFSVGTIYLISENKTYIISLIPGAFYVFVVLSYILNANIGFNLPWSWSYSIAGLLTVAYLIYVLRKGKTTTKTLTKA